MLSEDEKIVLRRLIHEMKTPLVAIRGSAQVAAEELKDNERALRYDYLGDISSWTELLMRLVSNAEYLFLRPPDFNHEAHVTRVLLLKDVFKPAITSVTPFLKERGFSSSRIRADDFSAIPPLYADAVGMRQVVFNLLSNCIKYAHDDPHAFRVQIDASRTRNTFQVTIQDWGIGIGEDVLPHIFEEGARGEQAALPNPSGHGIGLFVASQIMQALGGSLQVTKSGQPTEITLSFPERLAFARNQRRGNE